MCEGLHDSYQNKVNFLGGLEKLTSLKKIKSFFQSILAILIGLLRLHICKKRGSSILTRWEELEIGNRSVEFFFFSYLISYTRAIVDYIVHEARDKKGLEISPSDWKREAAIRTIPVLPQQHNGSDCGMFTLMFADFISDNLDLSGFSQSDIKDYRRKVVAAILRGSLNYDVY